MFLKKNRRELYWGVVFLPDWSPTVISEQG